MSGSNVNSLVSRRVRFLVDNNSDNPTGSQFPDNISRSVSKTLLEIAKLPPPQQAAVGATGGLVVGYASMKVGKWVLLTAGTGLILLQLASHQGYVNVNWKRINNEVKKAAKNLERKITESDGQTVWESLERLVRSHVYCVGGFAAGWLIGMGMA